jgi:hypothetical protein
MTFKRGSDPKESLGLGIYRERTFPDIQDATVWMIQNHLRVLEMDAAPRSNLSPDDIKKLRLYIDKYIHTENFDYFYKSNMIIGKITNYYRLLYDIPPYMASSRERDLEDWEKSETRLRRGASPQGDIP